MKVLSLSPFRCMPLIWQPRLDDWALTVVCKATYHLVPGEVILADQQEPLKKVDVHRDDDPSRSVYYPSDRLPGKANVDVLLVGHACSPRDEPVSSLLVRLVVGDVDKTIEVFCDRSWKRADQLVHGKPVTKFELSYERAAGGRDTDNPVGIRTGMSLADILFDNMRGGIRDRGNLMSVPSLQPPDCSPSASHDVVPSIGFGPIAPAWPPRVAKLGGHASTWSPTDWHGAPLPEGFDFSYFNSAPQDQQLGAIREDEQIMLEHIYPDQPRFVTSLSGDHPYAFHERADGAPEEIQMHCDTIWIDTDRAILTMTWRGRIALGHPQQPGQVLVARGRCDRRLLWPEVHALRVEGLTASSDRPHASPAAQEMGKTMALPPSPAPPPRPLHAEELLRTVRLPAGFSDGVPFLDARATLGVSSLARSAPVLPFAPSQDSESARTGAPTAALTPVVAPPLLGPSIEWNEPREAHHLGPGTAPLGPNARLGSLAEISSAAADVHGAWEPAPPAEPLSRPAPERQVRRVTREPIDLLWFDAGYTARIRNQPDWKVLLAELELRELDREGERSPSDGESERGEPEPPQKKARRDVFEILGCGDPLAPVQVKAALGVAVSEDGEIEPPLVLVAGKLKFAFDEIESLKAAVAAVRPLLAAADKKLKDAADAGAEILQSPWPEASRTLAARAARRITKAFDETRRELEPSYLDELVERAVLQGRHYQRRMVLGQVWLRALLDAGGPPQDALLVYLPESLAKELPMFPEMKARLIAEVKGQQDKYEQQTVALRAVALARAG